jgi:hypothetical protein
LRYDFTHDVLTLHNIRYAGELFRLIHRSPPGTLLELTAREDGVMTLREVNAPLQEPPTPPIHGGGSITLTIEPDE